MIIDLDKMHYERTLYIKEMRDYFHKLKKRTGTVNKQNNKRKR